MTICTELFRVSKSSKIADIFVRNFEDKVERRILGVGEDTLVLLFGFHKRFFYLNYKSRVKNNKKFIIFFESIIIIYYFSLTYSLSLSLVNY